MAVNGRKALPADERKARGTKIKRTLVQTTAAIVPAAVEGVMSAPDTVMTNERALHYWDFTLRSVGPGHLAPVDSPLLAAYCLALSRADEAETAMRETGGMVVKAPNTGLPIQSPYLAIVNRQIEVARKLASELAIPPASRNRLAIGKAPDADPADAFFQ